MGRPCLFSTMVLNCDPPNINANILAALLNCFWSFSGFKLRENFSSYSLQLLYFTFYWFYEIFCYILFINLNSTKVSKICQPTATVEEHCSRAPSCIQNLTSIMHYPLIYQTNGWRDFIALMISYELIYTGCWNIVWGDVRKQVSPLKTKEKSLFPSLHGFLNFVVCLLLIFAS